MSMWRVSRARAVHLALVFSALSHAACTQHSLVGLSDDPDTDGDAQIPNDGSGPRTLIDECGPNNAAGIDAQTVAALRSASNAALVSWLYPYDGTVFPRGISAPRLYWQGPVAQAARVDLSSPSVHYEGCVAVARSGELQLDERAFRAVEAASEGQSEPLTISLSILADGAVHGPLKVQVTLSSARALGSIAYQTYGSKLASMASVGSVMRVPLGGTAQPLLGQDSCAGCHSIAASGTRLIGTINGIGRSYPITKGMLGISASFITGLPGAEFAALDPTGRYYLATAHPVNAVNVGLPSYGASMQMVSNLYTVDGVAVANSNAPSAAMMPSFARDGKNAVFNDFSDGAGHGLSVAPFDASAVTLGTPRRFFVDDTLYPGWPAFLQDNRHVVFALGQSPKFGAEGALLFGKMDVGKPSNLALADTQTGASTILFRSSGYSSRDDAIAERTYLPFGAEDASHLFYPTVMATTPGAHGFICFDSIRHYGNRGLKRAIWCTAIDEGGVRADGGDPSHPAFFLPGQEEETDNIRPVAWNDTP